MGRDASFDLAYPFESPVSAEFEFRRHEAVGRINGVILTEGPIYKIGTLQPSIPNHRTLQRTLHRHFKWTKTLDKITRSGISATIEGIKAPSEGAMCSYVHVVRVGI